ncbi:hypothetical protein PENSPDRAFT_654525 [Peniophora sp. CONT]|nr:hypothetical protein PENSPDRAFT_654525 [Peniophora sp. CONT]
MSRSSSPLPLSPLSPSATPPSAPRPRCRELDEFRPLPDQPGEVQEAAPLVIPEGYGYFYGQMPTPPESPLSSLLKLGLGYLGMDVLQRVEDQLALLPPGLLFGSAPVTYTPAQIFTAVADVLIDLVNFAPPLSPAQSVHSLDDFDDGYSTSSEESGIATPPPPVMAPEPVVIVAPTEPVYTLGKRRRDSSEEADERPYKKARSTSAPPSPRPIATPRRVGATRSLNNIEDLRSTRSVGPAQGSTFRSK